MLQSIIGQQINRQEKAFGVSLDYVRHILKNSLGSFFKFGLFMPLAQHCKTLPKDAYAVARIVATRDEDCGDCVQLEVNQARDQGVAPEIIQAVLTDQPDNLPTDLAAVYHFTKAVVEQTGAEETHREPIRQRWGDEALVELALAIGACRVFPTVKRALGYARSCSMVKVGVKAAPTVQQNC